MRAIVLGSFLTVAVLLPINGSAQVFQFRTPPPDVSAASARWQIDSEPIVVDGLTYYPTRGFRLFDGQVMVQTGMYEGVPVYADATIAPFSEIYVPLGGGRMRIYERRREGELAGTMGSHTPTFPVESAAAPPPPERIVGSAGTGGSEVPRTTADTGARAAEMRTRPQRPQRTTIITGVPHSPVDEGVWVDFGGAHWYADGPAEPFSPDRFEPIGEYHGFPVYRDKISGSADIWVSVVKDGMLAPYAKR
jgi:hypothetical protein